MAISHNGTIKHLVGIINLAAFLAGEFPRLLSEVRANEVRLARLRHQYERQQRELLSEPDTPRGTRIPSSAIESEEQHARLAADELALRRQELDKLLALVRARLPGVYPQLVAARAARADDDDTDAGRLCVELGMIEAEANAEIIRLSTGRLDAEADHPGAEATGDTTDTSAPGDDWRSAEWLACHHGIYKSRLSEKAQDGKVRTMDAPHGYTDFEGKHPRKLYNVADALRECEPKRVTAATRRKLGFPQM